MVRADGVDAVVAGTSRSDENPHGLPRYHRPPVSEVVLAVAFEPLPHLTSPEIVRLWNSYASIFPRIEEQPPYVPPIERFGRASTLPAIHLSVGPTPGRYWFLNQDGNELIQVQRDWFARNWRRVSDEVVYPHFQNVAEPFAQDLERLQNFVAEASLGTIVPTQCEVTYVNAVDRRGVWSSHSDAHQVFTVWHDSDHSFLPPPEDELFIIRYAIPSAEGEPIGRLNVQCQAGFRDLERSEPIFVLNLTARGAPVGPGLQGVRAFFEIGHEWIVRGFTELTTEVMHDVWEKYG